MTMLAAVTLLVLGSVSVVVAGVAVYQGQIWCVPHRRFEWKARWVRRSQEGLAFWSNTVGIGSVGVGCLVAGCKILFRGG